MASENQNFPLAGLARDGWSTDDEATATCLCGAIQVSFPVSGEGFVNAFVCHCANCRKITASMFASNFVIKKTHLKWVRGRENLKEFTQSETIRRGNDMTNSFCSTCGGLMWRYSSGNPDIFFMRIGTVDDFHLHETKLRPQVEIFTEGRVAWLDAIEGVEQVHGMPNI
ncbi:Mss4-like protein [Stachybotrys elegans]|uniref:Mss4-like protein n=1 Tax=Stachybotrys elegans TaxID=80388 RepID=A0A8K0T284_9HYPO|nr:Mss4-like protein [Stachybotrys elegans]